MPRINKIKRRQIQMMRECREIVAKRRAERNNPDASLAADSTQYSAAAGNQENAPSSSFKTWVAAATNQPYSIGPSTSTQMLNLVPTLPIPQATSSSFRDWITAQAASTSTEPSKLFLQIEPLQTTKPEPAATLESLEPEYIALPEPEISDIVVKEEIDKPSDTTDDTDILASCSTSQLVDIELEPEPCTTEASTELNEIKVYLKPRIKTRTTHRNITQKTYFEPKPKPKLNPKKKQSRSQSHKVSDSSQKTSLLVERRPRARPRKQPVKKKIQCKCQKKDVKDASTSTEDLILVKQEKNNTEELRLFFELCDKFLDETTAEVAKLRASALSDSSWLVVTES